jgi:phosphatidylserine decarboxylase
LAVQNLQQTQGFRVSVASFAAAQLLRVLPRVRLSRAVGHLCDRPLSPVVSRAVQAAYCRAYRVDLSEALSNGEAYPSFDAFFTRRLRDDARRIGSDAVVSPADGSLVATGPIDAGARLSVKGRPYDAGELLGEASEAGRYSGGQFAVVYLAPRDYHRVHAPVDGSVRRVRSVPGDLFPVNRLGEEHVPRLFVVNQRVSIFFDTQELGSVAVVMVGAVIVGRISVAGIPGRDVPPGDHVIEPPLELRRGDEIGVFHLGSTVVVLLEPGVVVSRPLGRVRFGESLLGGP